MARSTCRVAWTTDIHLNFVWDKERGAFDEEYDDFINSIVDSDVDLVLVGGDIAEGPELIAYLERLAKSLAPRPLYFVLGNHDFYRSSLVKVRSDVTEICQARSDLVYLTAANAPIALTKRVALVGNDGWADGRFGELEWSRAKISDYTYIKELVEAGEEGRRQILNALGDTAAAQLLPVLEAAVQQYPEVVLLTHVPPWLEASRYRGQVSNYEYAPHFTSKVMGEMIVGVMNGAPQCRLTVLCGHTHHPAEHRPAPNIVCFAGQAEYGTPVLQRVLEFD